MKFEGNNIYHIYNRGNNRQKFFFTGDNYLFFLKKINELKPFCNILAYCLMPNHFHLMAYVLPTCPTAQSGRTSSAQSGRANSWAISRKIGTILSSYTQAINKQEKRTGSLFQQKTKAKCLLNKDRYYPKVCFHYIHQNPIRAKITTKMEDWEYSSFKDYAGLRKGVLPSIKFSNQLFDLPTNKIDFYKESYDAIPENIIMNIY